MAKPRLDKTLLEKIAQKTGKKPKYLREQISRRAGRHDISSLAAQAMWAKDLGIGVGRVQNKFPDIRREIQSVQGQLAGPVRGKLKAPSSALQRRKTRPITSATLNALLQDGQLRQRCKDLIEANKNLDRAFREATTVLDDRLKVKSGIEDMLPAALVSTVLNPDPQKAIIVFSTKKNEQEGFHAVCRGLVLAFRNKAHHRLSDKFSQADALKFCGFIDTVLGIIEASPIHLDRVEKGTSR